jgi:hypothetical protein
MNVLVLAVLSALGQIDEYVRDFHHDFRGAPLPAELGRQPWTDPPMTIEKEGLRIKLPKDRKSMMQVGVFTTFPVKGNFEITVAYEILHADQPEEGWGVGPTLYVIADRPDKNTSGIYRLNRPKLGPTIHWDSNFTNANKRPDANMARIACDANLFRLRMTRSKQTLSYFWAPGLTDEFRKIGSSEFVADDLRTVALNTTTGAKPYDLDARFLDLRIRSGAKSLTEGEAAPSLAERLGKRSRLLTVFVLFGVSLGAAFVTWWLRRRRQIVDGSGP